MKYNIRNNDKINYKLTYLFEIKILVVQNFTTVIYNVGNWWVGNGVNIKNLQFKENEPKGKLLIKWEYKKEKEKEEKKDQSISKKVGQKT